MLTRRVLFRATGATAVAGAGVGAYGVQQGWLPGRPFLQEAFGLNGEDGSVPAVDTGRVTTGSFRSKARLGAEVRYHVLRPRGAVLEGLPLVVGLHGLGWDIDAFLPDDFGLAEWLAEKVARGTSPFAIVVPDGGDTYWHPRPDGEDAGAMVVDELLPRLAKQGLRCTPQDRIGLMGWSMGGYGALRLGGLLGPERVAAVAVAAPALWSDADEASRAGFEDDAEYREYTVFGHQSDLEGIAVSIDCGTGDPFYRSVEDYVEGFPDRVDLRSSFEPGAHDRGFWRRVLPDQLAFLGSVLAET